MKKIHWNIDWDKIRDECPLAWSKLSDTNEWLTFEKSGDVGEWFDTGIRMEFREYNIRNLYEFFDSVNILVTIHTYLYFGRFFGAHVYVTDKNPRDPTETVSAMLTRVEAETKAFARAFYYYEEQLKQKYQKQ